MLAGGGGGGQITVRVVANIVNARVLRVTHIVRRFDPLMGGTERYVGDLARAQVAQGRNVTVVTLDRDVNGLTRGRLAPRQVDRGVRIVRLPGVGSPRFGLTYRPDLLLRAVRGSDVTHLHDLRFMVGTVALMNRLRGRPTLLHTHGLIYGTRAYWRLKRLLSRVYYEPLLRATNTHVVASSTADRERLAEYMPRLADNASTILNAVDLNPFTSVVRSAVPGQIAVVGRVTPLKGIDRLLRALPHVRVPWSLVVHGAGEGAEPSRLADVARGLGISDRVAFAGPFATEEEPGLLATPALAVFPSTSEALGMALVDAMAAGVPVLASQIPGHRNVLESVAPDSLVEFDRPTVAAASIDRLLALSEKDSAELSQRLRERARAFDVSRLIRDIDAMYEELGVRSH